MGATVLISTLTVTDFRAIRGTRTYELGAGVTALVGRNEAGKSSSLLALAYAFYGAQAMPEGVDTDDLINDHAKECGVAVLFDHNGDEYDLKRWQRRDGRGDAQLYRNGQMLASGRAPVTQAITQLFGVDHVGFMVSVFARQDELDALAGKKGAERITTMLRLLGVEQAEAAVKAIRKDANEERRRLEVLRAGVPDVDELQARKASDEKALADLSQQHESTAHVESVLSAEVDALSGFLATLQPKRDAFDQWRRECDAAEVAASTARVRLEDAQRRIMVVPPKPEPVEEGDHLVLLDEAQAAYEDARARWRAADDECKRLEGEIVALVSFCRECGRPFDNAEDMESHRESIKERIVALEEQRATAEKDGQAALSRRNALASYGHALQAFDEATERNTAAQAEADALLLQWQDARVALEEMEPPEDPSEAIDKTEADLEDKRQQHSAVNLRLATLTASIEGIENSLTRIDADLARAADKASEIKAAEKRVVTLDVAAKEMAAMKERLIGKIIPALEERASALVADLTDGKHSELRLTSDYEIQYVTPTGQLRSFANLSGGAQDVFALALRLAIAELRAGSVSFLVLDEVFESLDDERQALAWGAIERLGKRYSQVLVITHVAALRERAATVIAV